MPARECAEARLDCSWRSLSTASLYRLRADATFWLLELLRSAAIASSSSKRAADPVEWSARVEALRNVGLEALDIINRKGTKELWDASENLDAACENCHGSYWYPKEDTQFYQKLDRKLSELAKPSTSHK